MARGKHANASMVKRYHDTERENIFLRRSLNAEQRKHDETKRRAAHADGLELRCRELTMHLELATCEEIETLKDTVRKLQAELAERDERLDWLYRWGRRLSRWWVQYSDGYMMVEVDEADDLASAFGVPADRLFVEWFKLGSKNGYGPPGSATTPRSLQTTKDSEKAKHPQPFDPEKAERWTGAPPKGRSRSVISKAAKK